VYRVLVGAGALGRLVDDLARGRVGSLPHRPVHAAVVSDSMVAALYGRRLTEALSRAGLRSDLLVFPRGESSKTRETKARLEDRLLRLGFGRDGVIVALGGGVTGDLAGFLAATWHRGVPLIQAPTSLIAMLDASIGGKVGVDHPLAKNLIGAFHPPLAVYADTTTLETLPGPEFRAGLAEAVKCGAMVDAALFASIERDRAALLQREPGAVLRLVLAAARVKAGIVSLDERESGRRLLLNFGHTIGHAIEAASGYRLRHGEAVSIGMVLESRIAVRMGLFGQAGASRIERLLSALRLPTRLSRISLSVGSILTAAGRDKKARAGRTLFVLPSGIGRHAGGRRFSFPVPADLLRRVVSEAVSGYAPRR